MVNEQPGARAQRAALEHSSAAPGGRRCPGQQGASRPPWRPGRPSAPAPPRPSVPTHPLGLQASGFVGRAGPHLSGFTSLIILFNRLLQPLRQCGRCRHPGLEDGDTARRDSRAAGREVPGWVGSPRAHPAQVGLTSLSHALLRRCKPDSPLVFPFPLLPGPLDQLIFILSSTYSPMKGPQLVRRTQK